MRERPKVGVIPFGELTTEEIREDLEAALRNISNSDLEIVKSEPVFSQLETIRVASEFARQDLDLLVLIPLHGVTSVQQVLAAENCRVPTVIWALPVRYSLPSGAISHGTLRDRGFKVKIVYGAPNSADVVKKIASIARVAFTINRLKESRIGLIGGVFQPMVSAYYDKNILRDKLGPDVVRINIVDVKQAFSRVKEEEVDREFDSISQRFRIDVDEDILRKALKFHLALKRIVNELSLHGIAMECWSELLKEFGVNPCLGFIEDEYIIACEGDAVSCTALLMLKYLTNEPAALLDIFSLHDDVLRMGGHCAAPASLARTTKEVSIRKREPPSMMRMVAKLATVRPTIPNKNVTIIRLFGRNVDKIHLTTGKVIACDTSKAMEIDVKLTGDMEKFMENVCGNHYIVASGGIRKQLELLCSWLNLELIAN